jgi:NAD(P)-dependent dehydrogenase (short-subunit alcohol dehydrogenase family)
MPGRRGEVDAVRFEHDHDDDAGYDGGWHDSLLPSLRLFEDLRGRRAAVTGAGRGIGEAIATWLIDAGADVTVIDRDGDSLKEAFRTRSCQVLEGDINGGDVDELADELSSGGPVELLVNNVGITTPHRFLEIGGRELDLVYGTNLRGPWLLTTRLVKALIDHQARSPDRLPRPRGSILFISSLHDRFVAREAHYSVSKAGVAMLVQAMAKELGRYRIRVNAISPGWIRTAEDTTTPEQVANGWTSRRRRIGWARVERPCGPPCRVSDTGAIRDLTAPAGRRPDDRSLNARTVAIHRFCAAKRR